MGLTHTKMLCALFFRDVFIICPTFQVQILRCREGQWHGKRINTETPNNKKTKQTLHVFGVRQLHMAMLCTFYIAIQYTARSLDVLELLGHAQRQSLQVAARQAVTALHLALLKGLVKPRSQHNWSSPVEDGFLPRGSRNKPK